MSRLEAEYYTKLRDSINMKNLKKIIDEKGYTVIKLSTEANISDSTIYNYIKGERLPSISVLVELARLLNTSTDYLLGLTDNPLKECYTNKLNNDETTKYLIQNISSLSKEKQKLVAAYVKGLLDN